MTLLPPLTEPTMAHLALPPKRLLLPRQMPLPAHGSRSSHISHGVDAAEWAERPSP
jgi:hypothetical protein